MKGNLFKVEDTIRGPGYQPTTVTRAPMQKDRTKQPLVTIEAELTREMVKRELMTPREVEAQDLKALTKEKLLKKKFSEEKRKEEQKEVKAIHREKSKHPLIYDKVPADLLEPDVLAPIKATSQRSLTTTDERQTRENDSDTKRDEEED